MMKRIAEHPRVRSIFSKGILKNPYTLMGIYLLSAMNWLEYWKGEAYVIVNFLVLAGVYFYLNDKLPLAFFFWSFALNFKLYTIFLLILVFFTKPFSKLVKSLACIILAISPNLVMFAIWPDLITGFITLNTSIGLTSINAYMTAITNAISAIFQAFNASGAVALVISILILAAIFLPAVLFLLKENGRHLTIFDKLMILFLACIVIVPGFNYEHAIELDGVFLLWLATTSPRIPSWTKCVPIYAFLFIDGYFGLLPVFQYIGVLPLITLVFVCVFGFVKTGTFPNLEQSVTWPV
jgi:hypothetical protein